MEVAGVTYETIRENAVFLEDWHGEWEMYIDDPFHKFFVGEMRLAIVSDGVLQALAFARFCHSCTWYVIFWLGLRT